MNIHLASFFRAILAAAAILCAGWAQGGANPVSVSISGPSSIPSGGSAYYTSTVRYSDGSSRAAPASWWGNLASGIDATSGRVLLRFDTVTQDKTYTIYASVYNNNGTRIDSAPFRILVKAPTLKTLAIEGSDRIAAGEAGLYYCRATWSDGTTKLVEASFTISGNGESYGPFEGFAYYSNANPPRTGDIVYTVRASYNGRTVSKNVVIEGFAIEYLEIFGPLEIHSNGEGDFACLATWEDGLQDFIDPTWDIMSGAAYGTIDGIGHFRAESTRQERTVVLRASSGGVASDSFPVTITPKRISTLTIDTQGKNVLEAGDVLRCSALAVFDDGTEGAVEGTWTIGSGKNVGPCKGISWTTPSVKRDTRYTISFWCVDVDTCPFAETTVTVKGKNPARAWIEGPASVLSNAKSVPYRFVVEFSDGTTETVEASWSISSGRGYVAGMVADASGPAVRLDFVSSLAQLANAVTLRGSFTENGRTVSATIVITILHKSEVRLEISGPDRVTAGESAGYTATVFYDDGTSSSASPQVWTVDPSIDSIHGGTLSTRRTDEGRIDRIVADFQGTWAIVEGTKSVRVVGRGTQDPEVSGMTIRSLRVVHDHVRIPTPGAEEFRAIGIFVDGKGNRFERDVTDLCAWDMPLRSDREVAGLIGNVLESRNYGYYEEQVCVRATFIDSAGKTWRARGYVRVGPASTPPPGPYQRPGDVPPTVVGPGTTLDRLEIVGPAMLPSRGAATYSCRAVYGDGTVVLVVPAWSVFSGSGDTIDSSGVLRASTAQTDRTIRIQASFDGKTATKFVTVLGRSLSSLSISGPASVPSGGTASYSCVAHYDDGTEETVWASWTVASGGRYGSINSSGTLTAASTDEDGTVVIRAAFGSKTVSKTVRIVADDGSPALVSVPIYRFYSKNYKGHFFTMDEEEKDGLINSNPNWRYEGIAYYAFGEKGEGMVTLHRFYSKAYRGHFFTIDEEEMRTVRDTNPNWKYEGEAYYVYPVPTEGTVPVYRFWSKGYRHHFYTTDEEEKDSLIRTNPNWKYEGIAFYALEGEVLAPGGRSAESLSVSGPSSVPSGGTASFSCTAFFDDGTAEDVAPVWSVVSGGSYANVDESGFLSAADTDQDRSVTVRAAWNGFTADVRITVEARVPHPLEIGIEGAEYLASGETAVLSCAVFYDDGTSETVSPEWRIVSGGNLGTLSASGVFVATGSVGGPVEIEASWNGLTAEWTIRIEGDAEDGGLRTQVVDGLEWTFFVTNGEAWVGSGVRLGVTAIPTSTTGSVSIPSMLGGYPVVAIADYAFTECDEVTSFSIPSGVRSIGEMSFGGCYSLESITIPEGVEEIGTEAFTVCLGLVSVSIPASVSSIGDGAFFSCNRLETISLSGRNESFKLVDGVLFSMDGRTLVAMPSASPVSAVSSYQVPSGVEIIAPAAFSGCGFSTISLPPSVTTIGYQAFFRCFGISTISIPAGTSFVDPSAFWMSYGLETIAVDPSNAFYKSVDGILFTKDGTGLVVFPPGKATTSYEVPDGVTTLFDEAFFFCQNLTSLSIPDSVTKMGLNTLWGLSGLEYLRIPSRFRDYVETMQLPDKCTIVYTGASPSPSPQCEAWTLAAEDGTAIVPNGTTDCADFLIEARSDAPAADDLAEYPTREPRTATLALKLVLPGGAFDTALWSAADGTVADETAEGAFVFDLPVSGVWHWLRVRDETGEDSFRVWLRAE